MESLAEVLNLPAASSLRERLGRGEVAVSSLTADLLAVCYRLTFVAAARRRGGLVTEQEAVEGLSLTLLHPTLLDEAPLVALARVLDDPGGEPGAEAFGARLGALHGSL